MSSSPRPGKAPSRDLHVFCFRIDAALWRKFRNAVRNDGGREATRTLVVWIERYLERRERPSFPDEPKA